MIAAWCCACFGLTGSRVKFISWSAQNQLEVGVVILSFCRSLLPPIQRQGLWPICTVTLTILLTCCRLLGNAKNGSGGEFNLADEADSIAKCHCWPGRRPTGFGGCASVS